MDPTVGIAFGSANAENFRDEANGFSQEIGQSASSFTALLELPAMQATHLLHMSESVEFPAAFLSDDDLDARRIHSYGRLTFPSNPVLMDHAARFSVAAKEQIEDVSPESSSMPSNSCRCQPTVKAEPAETESSQPWVSDPTVNSRNQCQRQNQNNRLGKRKEREKKVNSSAKKSKTPEYDDKRPYVHVRARRGQATDSHSIAERARREKINAKMKLLQELVPGCNKIRGTTLVLDEIINHVLSLQRQVEVLSMKLAAVDPGIDFTLSPILSADSGSLMDSSISGRLAPMAWPEGTRNRQVQHLPQWPLDAFQNLDLGHGEDDYHNLITSENSLSSFVPSADLPD